MVASQATEAGSIPVPCSKLTTPPLVGGVVLFHAGRNNRPQCSGDDSSPCNVANRTCTDNRNHLPTCHSEGAKRVEESSRVACFILCWFLLQRGGFLHSACAAVGMTKTGERFPVLSVTVPSFRVLRFSCKIHHFVLRCLWCYRHPGSVLLSTGFVLIGRAEDSLRCILEEDG